ncbi:MAG TPA: hypothetical protein VLY04_15135 [Bryobacteraceae bacterium]|nr:hypothetical protein [Bryobacteraceae bacterium]
MKRSHLRLSAVVLTVLIVVVFARTLDRLPSSLKTQIASERAALPAAQTQLRAARGQVAAQVQSDPELFKSIAFGQQWSDRFVQADGELQSASHDLDDLARLEKRDRHSDSDQAASLLTHERQARAHALAGAGAIEKDAARWLDARNHLPEQARQMESDYQAIHAFDLAALTAAVHRAETDWPDKKADLEARLAAESALVADSDRAWQSSEAARRKAAANDSAGLEFGALFGAGESLKNSEADLQAKGDELKTLTGQLYTSWDKVLVDMQTSGGGDSRQYQQRIRTVRTHYADAAASTGETTSDEQWTTVPRSTYDAMRPDLGMAIEHKPAGKYDSEAQRVAQPAGLAYVAPLAEGRNQYGYWDHRDGRDFWVFYGQYALLRDLLFNHDYRPIERREWEDYRTYQSRGETYYGHDSSTGQQKYGSQGTVTQNRYAGSKYGRSGGFHDSQYASKPGSYSSSRYASPSMRDPNADHSPKTFGHNASPQSAPRAAPPARTYHPAPSRPPMRSPGRSFGRRH